MSNEALPRLFIFCIGGTGARVLKALTFLLATGVEIKASQIIPIIIDPDRDNGDVERTAEILRKYQEIRHKIETDENKFFQTEIQTLASLQEKSANAHNLKVSIGFKFDIDGTRDGRFKQFINCNNRNDVEWRAKRMKLWLPQST